MKELDESGVEYVDGRPVDLYEMKFSGSIFLDAAEAAQISAGDLVSFIVVARATTPSFKEVKKAKTPTKLKRVNACKLEELHPITPDRAKFLYDAFQIKVEGVNDGIVNTGYVPSSSEQVLGFDPQEAML